MGKNSMKLLGGKFGIFGNLLVFLSMLLIFVILFNILFGDALNKKEGFEQKEKVVIKEGPDVFDDFYVSCLLYTSPSPRDSTLSRMPSSA